MNLKKIMTPAMGESVTEATVLKINKKVGDSFSDKDVIIELETDKINVDVTADSSGILKNLLIKEGDVIKADQVLAEYEEISSEALEKNKAPEAPAIEAPVNKEMPVNKEINSEIVTQQRISLGASNLLNNLNSEQVKDLDIKASGKNGSLITKLDVSNAINAEKTEPKKSLSANEVNQDVEIVKMSGLRKTIARRLKEAQNTAAILTTFNEVDLTEAMSLRQKYQEKFQKKYGVKLGFMSIFARASVLALKEFPAVNAEISGDNIIYKNFCNIGVAIGSEKGLVVPILRNVENLGLHEIEIEIGNYATKAKNGTLKPDDFAGGTFTISNGGVYGSLMSTPIINPPQSAILGMHSIVERPVARNGQVVIRPMMYLALSYDHRIIDGKEAVSFLKRIVEYVENPERMILFI